LVLQDDGHLLRIFCLETRRYHHARMIGLERYVKMMPTRQATCGDMRQCLDHHLAKRHLGPRLIGQQAFRPLILIVFHAALSLPAHK
jgi:hypothetical protein